MKKKLELRHIASHFPYGLKVQIYGHIHTVPNFRNDEVEMISDELITFKGFTPDWYFNSEENEIDIKLILRPLSSLSEYFSTLFDTQEEIEDYLKIHLLEPQFSIYQIENRYCDILHLPYFIVNKLLEHHFDIANLIPQGLALDINKLP